MISDSGIPQYEGEATSLISLHVSCRNLFKMDVFSPSDPLVKIYTKEQTRKGEQWKLLGATEHIENDPNPNFVKYFEMEYFFERQQWLKVVVHDVDQVNGRQELSLIGETKLKLGQVMGAPNLTFINDITLPGRVESRGKLVLRADSINSSNDEIQLSIKADRLKSCKTLFGAVGKDDPFFYLSRGREE